MSSVTLDREMVRRNDATAKIDAEVLRMVRLVAEYRGITAAEYLTEVVRPIVEKDLEHEQANFRLPRRGGKGGEPDRPRPKRESKG
jgi:hypothetical protein